MKTFRLSIQKPDTFFPPGAEFYSYEVIEYACKDWEVSCILICGENTAIEFKKYLPSGEQVTERFYGKIKFEII